MSETLLGVQMPAKRRLSSRDGPTRRAARGVALTVGLGLLAMMLAPFVARGARGRAVERRTATLVALEAHAPSGPILDAALSARVSRLGSLLASWETVGGCGAGASTGTGAGVKWIGRNVTGGLFHVELQSNYVQTS